MIKKLFFIVPLLFLISCSKTVISPAVYSELQKNNNITLVSFIKDNPQFLYENKPLTPSDVEKVLREDEYSDLKDLDGPSSNQTKKQKKVTPKTNDKTYFSTYEATQDLLINQYLMKSFIVQFRKRTNAYQIKHNLEVSKKVVPLLNNSPKNKIDRNFSSVKEELGNDLVFEIRVLELHLSRDITEDDPESSGFLNSIGCVVTIKGFLFNIKTQEKIWESDRIRAWHDSRYVNVESFNEDGGKALQKFYQIACNGAARILLTQFLGE